MKIRKIAAVFLLALVADLIVSCCNCDDVPRYNTHDRISVYNLDNGGASPFTAMGPVPRSAYGIRLIIKMEEKSDAAAQTLFMGKACAFDCDCASNMFATETVTDIKIKTRGNDITSGFMVKNFSMPYITVEEFVTQINDYPQPEREATLLLIASPGEAGLYSFLIEITLSDGRVLSAQTDEIELT